MATFLILICLATVLNNSYAEYYSIIGKVLDEENNRPIAGARISLINSNLGTFSSSSGFFRLPKVKLNEKIRISSLGYESKTFEITKIDKDTLLVFLTAKPVSLPEVEKVSDIEVDEIIRRAIRKKWENLSNIRTLQARLYSKLFFESGGPTFESPKSRPSGIDITLSPIKEKDSLEIEFVKNFILETFSNLYADYSQKIKVVEITERRQTANFPSQSNLISFTEFYNFYEEKVNILNTVFITPLAENSLDYYKFKLIGKKLYNNYYVYDIAVEPKTRIFPTFVGTIKIVENNYNLLELDLRPSEYSEVPMLDSISFVQKFTQIDAKVWQPTYFQFSAKAKLTVLKGLLDFWIKFNATSIVNDAIINQPLPDSIYHKYTNNSTIISPKADSTTAEFWENNTLRETTTKEIEIYHRIDSIGKKINYSFRIDTLPQFKTFDFGLGPSSINTYYNRVVGLAISMEPFIKFQNIEIKVSPYYSFGLNKPFGTSTITHKNKNLELSLSIFSKIDYTSLERECHPLLSTMIAYLFHWDYYDYFRKDGFSINTSLNTGSFALAIGFENSRHFSLNKTTDKSLFSNSIWRPNPKIDQGTFQYVNFEINFGNYFVPSKSTFDKIFFDLNKRTSISFRTRLLLGVNKTTNIPFGLFDCSLYFTLPLIFTGYRPIAIDLRLDYGNSTKELPLQFHFRLPVGVLYSAPFGKYGGTEYYLGILTLNIGDIWWRWIGLPKIDGKGIELKFSIGAGKTNNNSEKQIYSSSGKDFYTEYGIGLSRIPTFISNLVYLDIESRWGFGQLGKGNWRFNLNIVLPF